ncbi:MAG: hypothetical protein ACOCX9_05465 [Spirochaetota bacterium]
MRSRLTNVLQAIVLFTGLVYMITGVTFAFSPQLFGTIFGVHITADWYESIKFDTFIAPLYHFSRAFAVMIAVAGFAMILPLFDPLRYRGLVYYTGVLFPLISSLLLLVNGLKYQHTILVAMGSVFGIICILTVTGLIMTRGQAKMGEE